jgi:hypothetical protein
MPPVITLIVAIVVIPMVAAMIIRLNLIVVAMVGIPWTHRNGDLSFRFRGNQSQKCRGG